MAVLCEAISVVIKRESIDEYFQGDWAEFLTKIQNPMFCTDGQLVRFGFMSPNDVGQFIGLLVKNGLQFNEEQMRMKNDIVVVDQQRGPTMACDWIEFAHLPMGQDGGSISVCWLFEGQRIAHGIHMPSKSMDISMPDGWVFERSLSHKFKFTEELAPTEPVTRQTH